MPAIIFLVILLKIHPLNSFSSSLEKYLDLINISYPMALLWQLYELYAKDEFLFKSFRIVKFSNWNSSIINIVATFV